MRVPTGGGAGWPRNCTHACNNFQDVIVTPHSVMFSPPILPETLHFLCNNGFRVGMLEVNIHFLCSLPTMDANCLKQIQALAPLYHTREHSKATKIQSIFRGQARGRAWSWFRPRLLTRVGKVGIREESKLHEVHIGVIFLCALTKNQ